MRPLAIALVSSLAFGCYAPNPADKGFKCTTDNNYACPEGTACDRQAGLCVHALPDLALVPADLGFAVDQSAPAGPRTCDQRVRQGAFSGLTALSSLNTPDDETSISVSANGARIFYLSGGSLTTATLSGKSAGPAASVTIAGAPARILSGSVNADGSWWFAGNDGAGGATSLYQARGTLPSLTATVIAQPTTATQQNNCAFRDPVFRDGMDTNDLYLAYPLGGCGTAPYIARGAANKQIGAFFSALPVAGYRSPSLLPGGLTMLFSSVAPNQAGRLFFATRPTTDDTLGDTNWVGPTLLPLGAVAASPGHDLQAVVSPDCSTIYFVSSRAGGAGGADVYAADIAPQ